jgi:hypothetical protein
VKYYLNGRLAGSSCEQEYVLGSFQNSAPIIFSPNLTGHQNTHYIDGFFISHSEAKDANWVNDVWRNGAGRKFEDKDLVGLSGYANFDESIFYLRVFDGAGYFNYLGYWGEDVSIVPGGIP